VGEEIEAKAVYYHVVDRIILVAGTLNVGIIIGCFIILPWRAGCEHLCVMQSGMRRATSTETRVK